MGTMSLFMMEIQQQWQEVPLIRTSVCSTEQQMYSKQQATDEIKCMESSTMTMNINPRFVAGETNIPTLKEGKTYREISITDTLQRQKKERPMSVTTLTTTNIYPESTVVKSRMVTSDIESTSTKYNL